MSFKVGDEVAIDHPKYPGIWIVKKFNRTTVDVTPKNGGRSLRAPRYMLSDPKNDNATVTVVPTVEYYTPGEFVRVTAGRFVGLYVVMADRGEKVNLVKPGGDPD